MYPTSASLVVYRTPAAELQQLFRTLQQATEAWIVVDNSANEVEAAERDAAVRAHGGIYLPSRTNVGFGAGHNLALRHLEAQGYRSPYHMVVNPDIAFDPAIVQKMAVVLESRQDVGWIMPQVRFVDGSIQHLCKLLPTPFDLFVRRFLPDSLRPSQEKYELRQMEQAATTDVPFLSGCFIFARRHLLRRVGGFDHAYFMYMEDVDLCRRMRQHAKLLYWPEVSVTHGYCRGSHHHLRLTAFHVWSALRYFQRWGWFFDPVRTRVNMEALNALERHRGVTDRQFQAYSIEKKSFGARIRPAKRGWPAGTLEPTFKKPQL